MTGKPDFVLFLILGRLKKPGAEQFAEADHCISESASWIEVGKIRFSCIDSSLDSADTLIVEETIELLMDEDLVRQEEGVEAISDAQGSPDLLAQLPGC